MGEASLGTPIHPHFFSPLPKANTGLVSGLQEVILSYLPQPQKGTGELVLGQLQSALFPQLSKPTLQYLGAKGSRSEYPKLKPTISFSLSLP